MNIPIWLIPWKAREVIEAQARALVQKELEISQEKLVLAETHRGIESNRKVTEDMISELISEKDNITRTSEEMKSDLVVRQSQVKALREHVAADASEIERLKVRLQVAEDRIQKQARALASVSLWIRNAHRIDNPAAEGTIRKLVMETT